MEGPLVDDDVDDGADDVVDVDLPASMAEQAAEFEPRPPNCLRSLKPQQQQQPWRQQNLAPMTTMMEAADDV